MKVYEAIFDGKEDSGVYALSVVENPAMEDHWITLSEQPREIQFEAVDEEKRLLLGAALIPNKKVYRNMDGHEFFVTFSEKTIEDVAHAFIMRGYQRNSSINHETPIDGVSVVQSWTVEDPQMDKSVKFGKQYEKGTWVAMMKVEDDATWQMAKQGKLTGFSIDALLGLREIKFSDMSETKKSLKDQVFEVLKELGLKKEDKAEVKMGQLKLKGGEVTVEFEGEAPEVGMPVFILQEDDQRERMPEGEHELESGEFLHVDKNGLVAEAPVEEPENVGEVLAEMAKTFKAEMSAMEEKFEARFSDLTTENEKLKAEVKAKADEVQKLEAKLKEEPAAKKIVPAQLKYQEPKTAKERLFNAVASAIN